MTVVYSSQATTLTLANSNGYHQPVEEEQYFSTFFCRALYDYQTDNEASLSFKRDDIIEVLTKLDSGWWDGLLGQERGWFPSNYVAIISDQEADVAFSTTEAVSGIMHPQFADEVDDTHDLPIHHGWEQQLELDVNLPTYSSHNERDNVSMSSDFWVPQVSSDGRIYYLNTQTGQHSLDLPQDNQDISNGDLTRISAQTDSRDAVLGLGATPSFPSVNGHSETGNAGFGLPPRTGTPDPWKKILADDGMSYYFLNTFDGTVSWTLPSSNPGTAGGPGVHAQVEESIRTLTISSSDAETSTVVSSTVNSSVQRLRSESSASYSKDGNYNSDDRYSIHSDDSDIQPPPRQRSESSNSPKRPGNDPVVVPSSLKIKPRIPQKTPDPTPAEQTAQSLQQVLAPPPPADVNELSTLARESILAVVQYIQSHDVWVHQRYAQELNEQVLTVVHNVRNLLYVSATPSGHIPSNLYSRDTRNTRPTPASQSLQAHLKPAQRKVAGTLSKLVLSTLAILYDSSSPSAENPLRMEADASELERAILAFVVEVQSFFNQNSHTSDKGSIKRLYGAFMPQNIGLGLLGAGAAGGWKGFGWMALGEMDDAPHRLLSVEVVSELKTHVSNVEAKRVQFIDASTDHAKPHNVLARECQEFIRRLYACVAFVCNIHVARHVDIDGINADKGHAPNRDLYLQTVDKARRLVRTLEVAVQAVYDDGASFLLLAQSIRSEGAGSSPWVTLVSLSSSLKQSLDLVVQSCEALLSVGHDQAELGQGDYNGSIEWRMSRISMVDNQFGDILLDAAKASAALEKINMEMALRRTETKTKVSSDVDESPGFHRNPSQTSEDLLEPGGDSDLDLDMSIIPQRLDPKIHVISSDGPPVQPAMFENEGPAASNPPSRGAKLLRVLGADAPQAYIDKINADSKKWYLRSDHPPGDLQTDPEGTVRD